MKYFITCKCDVYRRSDDDEENLERYDHEFKIHTREPQVYQDLTFETEQKPAIIAVIYKTGDSFSSISGEVQYLQPKDMNNAEKIIRLVKWSAVLDKYRPDWGTANLRKIRANEMRAEIIKNEVLEKLIGLCVNFQYPQWTGHFERLQRIELITL